MLQDQIDRINTLRQQALANAEFQRSAKAHEKAIQEEIQPISMKKNKKLKSLSDIYKQYDFGV